MGRLGTVWRSMLRHYKNAEKRKEKKEGTMNRASTA